MKAASAREGDATARAEVRRDAERYTTALIHGQYEKRRSVGVASHERDERAHEGHIVELSLSGYETDPLFHNLGGRFVNVSTATGCGLTDDGRGVVAMDLDRDGDQDLVVHNMASPQVTALVNELGRGRTVVVSLRGTKSNRFGVGAQVKARGQAQVMSCGAGYLSSPPPELVFGLGDAAAIDRIEILWPGGAVQAVENVAAGRVTIEEGKGVVSHVAHAKRAPLARTNERIVREGDRVEAGAPRVMFFWSQFCRSCKAQVEGQREMVTELRRVDPSIELVMRNIDKESAAGFVPACDPVVPLVVVVDAGGVVRARHVGAQSPSEMAAMVKKALGK